MLYLILLYIYLTVGCFWAGLIFYALFPGISDNKKEPSYQRPLVAHLLSGLLLLTALGQWLALFFPLRPYGLFIICLILLLSTLLLRKKLTILTRPIFQRTSLANRYVSLLFIGCCCAGLFTILVLNAGPVIMDDTGSYHIQNIKWIQEYGTVPGIANLHHRFGYNSSWFISIALLVPSIGGIDHFQALNGLLSCWLFYYLLEKIFTAYTSSPHAARTAIACSLILLFTLICWPLIRGNAATANYDFITTCVVIVMFMESAAALPSPLIPEGILWPCFLFTVRMINAPIAIFALVPFFLLQKDHKKKLLPFFLAGIFLIIPFIWRNVLLSGYPFYPIYQIDPFHVDWKVSRPLLTKVAEFNTHFNRGDLETPRLSFPAWLPAWFRAQPLYNKLLLGTTLASMIIIVVRWKKSLRMRPVHYQLLVLVLIAQLCSWLFIAPDPRFVYASLLCLLFAAITELSIPLSLTQCRKVITPLIIIVTGALIIYTTRKTLTDPDYDNVLLPHSLPHPSTQDIVVGHIVLHIPDKVLDNWNPRCYDLPLPCLYVKDPALQARGERIQDGFRISKEAIPSNRWDLMFK